VRVRGGEGVKGMRLRMSVRVSMRVSVRMKVEGQGEV
jgi:hypothetical protein